MLLKARPTVAAVIVHQYNFLQQLSRCLVDDAAYGSFDGGERLVQVDQHDADGGKVVWVLFLSTPVREKVICFSVLNEMQQVFLFPRVTWGAWCRGSLC